MRSEAEQRCQGLRGRATCERGWPGSELIMRSSAVGVADVGRDPYRENLLARQSKLGKFRRSEICDVGGLGCGRT